MPSFQGIGKTSYEMITIRMNSSSSSEKSVLPWTHETRLSYRSTLLDSVVSCRDGQNIDGLQTCSHEEADNQMLVHVKDTKSVMIRTVDTDIVVLTAAYFQGLPNLEQLWIAFVTSKDFRYSVHPDP